MSVYFIYCYRLLGFLGMEYWVYEVNLAALLCPCLLLGGNYLLMIRGRCAIKLFVIYWFLFSGLYR